MAVSAHPVAPGAEAVVRTFGESTAVISSGPWFSAVTSTVFADAAAEAHEAGAHELVLDLTAVRAIDSAGTLTLSTLVEQLDEVGCKTALAVTHAGLVDWLTVTPFDADLDVYSTVEGALADLLRRPV